MNDVNKACSCPSGDGSLRHPCPAHPPLPDNQPVKGLSWADYWIERGHPDVAHDFDAFSRAEAWALQRFQNARQLVGEITNTEIDARLNTLYRDMVASGKHNGGMSGVAWDRAVYRMASSQPAEAVNLEQVAAWVPTKLFSDGVVAMTARREPPSAIAVGLHGEYLPLFRQPTQAVNVAKLTRWTIPSTECTCCEGDSEPLQDADGDWVTFADVKALIDSRTVQSAQAADLGLIRDLIDYAESGKVAEPSMVERMRALIDSQAVGNG